MKFKRLGRSGLLVDWSDHECQSVPKKDSENVKITTKNQEIFEENLNEVVEDAVDSYEVFVNMIYSRIQQESSAENAKEKKMEVNPSEEGESDHFYAAGHRPSRSWQLQIFNPKRGWTTVYRGSGLSCRVKQVSAEQKHRFRLSLLDDGRDFDPAPEIFEVEKDDVALSSGRMLYEAASKGSVSGITQALKQIKANGLSEALDACADDGLTCAVACAKMGHKEAFTMLLEGGAGALVTTGGPHISPLHGAAWGGNEIIIKRLEVAGASWNDLDKSGLSPLDYAIMNCNDDVIAGLVRSPHWLKIRSCQPIATSLNRAAAHGYANNKAKTTNGALQSQDLDNLKKFERIVELLLPEIGPDEGAEQDDEDGNSAQHAAALYNQPTMLGKLIVSGGDVEKKNDFGFSASDFDSNSTEL